MFNVTILKMKDIKKYLIGMIITVVIIILITNYLPKIPDQSNAIKKSFTNRSMIECLEQELSTISVISGENTENNKIQEIKEESLLQSILKTQISSIRGIENIEKKSQNNIAIAQEDQNEKDTTNQEENNADEQNANNIIQTAKTGLKTEIITNNPLTENFNSQYHTVKIKNETDYNLTEEMLTPDITIDNKNILIFHTHTCESYTSSPAYSYTPTGNFRTTDLNYTVARVGTELENQLKQYNLNVIHDTTYHDYPSYNGSYANSLATVQNIVKTNPSDIIIDLHRDAIGSRSDYAPIVKIGDEDVAAQIMFVIRN